MRNLTFQLLSIILLITFNLVNSNEIKSKTFPGFEGIIAAFGDFNSDKFTDIFLIKNGLKCFQVILQNPATTENDQQIFDQEKYKTLKRNCLIDGKDYNRKIVGLIPADFDGDAQMDVAVVIFDESTKLYTLIILKGLKTYFVDEKALFNSTNLTSQPLLLDYDGDMISDLLISESGEDGKPAYFIIHGGKTFKKIPFDPKRKEIEILENNSHAFIDLNGDGVSDIFIEEKNEMHYYFAGKDGFDKSHTLKYPKEYDIIGSSTFCDINSDEKIDHLIPVCTERLNNKRSCSILIYNDKNDDWDVLVKEIKVDDEHFYFETVSTGAGTKADPKIKLPIRLRHGYVNENGFLDLMALMKSEKSNKNDEKHGWHVVLFNNKKTDQGLSFEIRALNETINGTPILAAFFDLYEDGVVDILVNYEKNTSPNISEFKALTLNDFADVNFVKILVTSGLCTNDNCYGKDAYGEDTYLTPYGTNSPGPMVCYQLINSNSNAMKSCGGQLSQSSNFALQMPYTIFGLGLYANYIESITVFMPTGNTTVRLKKRVEQIVPDSQIVFVPNPLNDPNSWKVKLFLTPSDIIFKTLYTLLGICVFLLIIICGLHRKEMLEDVKEQAEFKKQWPELRR